MLTVPPSLSFGVGWVLFLLLSFFIRDVSKHHQEGRVSFARLSFNLSRFARHLRQNHPKGPWHVGDHDRIIAHLAAYPLALGKPYDNKAIKLLLHAQDVVDIETAAVPHYHCLIDGRPVVLRCHRA